MQPHITSENIEKIERKIFFKYKYHLATIFLICFIFAYGAWRSIVAIAFMEQQAVNTQTLKYINDWGKIDSSLKIEMQKIDQLNLNIKKEIEQQLIKENGNLKKISISKIYEKFPKLDNTDIELVLLDPQGVPIEHPENPAYANKGSIEKNTLEEFRANSNSSNSYIFTKKETKKIVFLRPLELQNKSISGLLSIEINPKILVSFSEAAQASMFESIYIFDNKNITLYGGSLHNNSSVDEIKFNDFSTLANFIRTGDILFNSPPDNDSPISWAVFSSEKNFLSDWLIIKKLRMRNTILVLTAMLLAVAFLVYFFRKFVKTEGENQLNLIKLKNSITEKENVVALLSHEIRTPINVILGLSQLSDDSSITKEELIKNNDSIKSATKYLTKLLNEILTFNKLSATNFKLEESFYQIDEIFNNLQSLFKNRSKKDVSIIFSNKISTHLLVKCDEFQIQQILINLIENSLKFTKEGSIEVTAEEITRGDDTVIIRFSVADTGIGIKKGEQALIFEPFTQANPSIVRNFGGTGLGLAISKRIVERLGGQLEITSEEGVGSCFYFDIEFNFQIEESTQENSLTTSSPSIIDPSPAKIDFESLNMSGRVLLIDDHLTTLAVMEKFLQKIGLNVTAVSDGKNAIEQVITNKRFDIIIIDVQMPGLTGLETTKIIRLYEDENQIQRVPIISLSANTSEKNIEDCILAGMDDFIEKPADFNKIHQVINTWIRN